MNMEEMTKRMAKRMIDGEASDREVADFVTCYPDRKSREFIRGVAVRLGYRYPADLAGRRPRYTMRVPGEDMFEEGREDIRNRKAGYAFASEALSDRMTTSRDTPA